MLPCWISDFTWNLDHSGMCIVLNQYFWWRPIPLTTSYLGNQNDLQAQNDWLFPTFLGHSRASLPRLIVYFILIIIGRMSYWYVKYPKSIVSVLSSNAEDSAYVPRTRFLLSTTNTSLEGLYFKYISEDLRVISM